MYTIDILFLVIFFCYDFLLVDFAYCSYKVHATSAHQHRVCSIGCSKSQTSETTVKHTRQCTFLRYPLYEIMTTRARSSTGFFYGVQCNDFLADKHRTSYNAIGTGEHWSATALLCNLIRANCWAHGSATDLWIRFRFRFFSFFLLILLCRSFAVCIKSKFARHIRRHKMEIG